MLKSSIQNAKACYSNRSRPSFRVLLNELEKAGLAGKYTYSLKPRISYKTCRSEGVAGHPRKTLNKSTFTICKGMTPETIDKPISSLDIIPTLSNLLGLEVIKGF